MRPAPRALPLAAAVAMLAGCLPEPATPAPSDTAETPTDPTDTPPVDTVPDGPGERPLACPPEVEAALAGWVAWPARRSCGHLYVQHADAGHALQVHLQTRDRAPTVGGSYEVDLSAPAGQTAWVLVDEGSGLAPLCTVGGDTGATLPQPTRTWRADAGQLAFAVTQVTDAPAFQADLTVTGVILQEVGGTGRCALPDATLTGLALGWYPAEG